MGCPMAALAFVLALHPALNQIQQALRSLDPTAQVTAYMDDITILIHRDHVGRALEISVAALQPLGLQLNPAKIECWIHTDSIPASDEHQGVKRTPQATILRTTPHITPIFPTQYAQSHALPPEYESHRPPAGDG